ncbi:GtrA family protein [Ilumatobacter nonamiensis]|uniref:GtrA family protein n=1 Tax=Ilumatobacter nonamiensis TaxID=467093 RepID=UPI00034754C5|nr:GtrA family protein [Ilumatobacter nonamiensis]
MTHLDAIFGSARDDRPTALQKVSKSLLVSLATSALSLSVLGVLTFTDSVTAGVANVIATISGIGPSYALNRRWVWRREGRSSIRREIGPFWAMGLLALVASTLTVSSAAGWAEARGVSDATRTTLVLAVNIVTFGGLWIVQYLVLDRYLFRPARHREPHSTGERRLRDLDERLVDK